MRSLFHNLLLALAIAAVPAQADVTVTARFEPGVISFNPNEPHVYIMFVNVTASGFTDDLNPDNYVKLASDNDSFSGESYPAGGSGGSSSAGFSSTADLSNGINSDLAWTLTIVDGATQTTSLYSVMVTTPGIPAGYIRPMTLDIAPGQPIDPNPIFNFTQGPAFGLPQSDNTSGYAFMLGDLGSYYGEPPLNISGTSWAPDGPLADDSYVVVVAKRNDAPPQTLIQATNPLPLGGAPSLADFNQSVQIQASAQSDDLLVGEPVTGPATDITVQFNAAVISFSPLEDPIYILGVGLTGSGFTDDDDEDNYIVLRSGDNAFSGDLYPALGTGSGTMGSIGLSSASQLSSRINAGNPWTLEVTDGATGSVQTYTLNVTTPGIPAGHMRPITLDTPPGQIIGSAPTFYFNQAPPALPSSSDDTSVGVLFGSNPASYLSTPGLPANASSWTPDGPLAQNEYLLLILRQNEDPPQTLISATTPTPTSGVPLASFDYSIITQSSAQSSDLIVQACSSDFNGDGDFGTDGDIEAFFACLGGNCCNTCQTSDFDLDGDYGTDQDIESFFRVLGGGAC